MLYIAVAIDVLHALIMAAWVVGLPLLFWRRYPKLSLYYCLFSVAFIVVNQVSHYTLGECVFTTIANWFYSKSGSGAPNEWFTVRLSRLVFGVVPTHRGVKVATQIMIGISSVGGIYSIYKARKKQHD